MKETVIQWNELDINKPYPHFNQLVLLKTAIGSIHLGKLISIDANGFNFKLNDDEPTNFLGKPCKKGFFPIKYFSIIKEE